MAARVENAHLSKAYGLAQTDINEMRALYDEWATTYDKDLAEASQDYVGPAVAATFVAKSLGGDQINPDVKILDAGCGTGLVGIHLAKLGAKKVDGCDLSPGMLDIARKTGVYKDLEAVDLSQPVSNQDNSYDVIVCVGTMTQGHVGPNVIDEFVRITRPNGFIVATVLESIWAPQGYEAKVQNLVNAGKVNFTTSELVDYRRGAGVQARMIVLKVL